MSRPDTITLRDGRSISLRELRQFHTYEGLLEGVPTRAGNRRRMDELVAAERSRGPALLIEPTERDDPFGDPQKGILPDLTCVGRFATASGVIGDDWGFTELVLIWFQRDFALPIAPEVLARVVDVPWDQHARVVLL